GAAKQLAASLRVVRAKRTEMFKQMTASNVYSPYGQTLVAADRTEYDRAAKEYKEAQFAYLVLRKTLLQDFPILASFAIANAEAPGMEVEGSADKLEKIGQGVTPDLARTLNEEVNDKLEKIGQVRWYLDRDELNIWQLDTLVAGTKEAMKVRPGSLQERVVND